MMLQVSKLNLLRHSFTGSRLTKGFPLGEPPAEEPRQPAGIDSHSRTSTSILQEKRRMKLSSFAVAALLCSALASNEASSGDHTSVASVEEMEQVFYRSGRAHSDTMAAITESMSPKMAWNVLEKNNLTTPVLVEMASDLQEKRSHPRKQPKGYACLDDAQKLLNDMIFEPMSKYDAEIAKCTEYYAQQCAATEACRERIAASNFIAANSRTLIMDAQTRINRCEVDIPTRKLELEIRNEKCVRELHKMKSRLEVILGNSKVMTIILKMTDCDENKFIQTSVLRCEDPCIKKSFITLKQDELKKQIPQLQSATSNELVQDTFVDLFEGVESLEPMERIQPDAYVEPIIDKTKFNNPPVPRTKVPMKPCSDPNAGAPSTETKRAAKCTLTGAKCYKLQERFLLIQSGIKDDRDTLLEDIISIEKHCEETKITLETQITNDEDMFSDAKIKLGFATEKETTVGETARLTAAVNDQLDSDLRKQMKTCTGKYINFETELCALGKIRGELMKMKGDGHPGFFQDCDQFNATKREQDFAINDAIWKELCVQGIDADAMTAQVAQKPWSHDRY